MSGARRGQAIRVMVNLANWQQEEPTGCGGGRQLSMDGTSRVTGDSHARFCERLGVKFPGATRRCRVTGIPTATAGQGLPNLSAPLVNCPERTAASARRRRTPAGEMGAGRRHHRNLRQGDYLQQYSVGNGPLSGAGEDEWDHL